MSDVHETISSLIAAYAIGAVPEDEIASIRAHILTCEECFADAERLSRDAAVLSETVVAVPLPQGFEDRVLQEALGDRKDRERHLPRGRRIRVPVLSGAAAVLATLLVIAGVSFVQSLERQRLYQETVAALMHDRVAFAMEGAGRAEAVVASTSDGSVLVAVDLGEAPENRDYQLWLMKDGVPTPGDTFDVSDSVVIIESQYDLHGFDGAAVTVEPEGGSETPTTEPVLVSS